MNSKLTKAVAVLSAVTILTSSSVLASNVPQNAAAPTTTSTSQPGYRMGLDFDLSYQLSSSHLTATISVTPQDRLQLRSMTPTVTITQHSGSSQKTIPTGTLPMSPYSIKIDTAVNFNEGDYLTISVYATGAAFYGYTYIGESSGSDSFTLTMK